MPGRGGLTDRAWAAIAVLWHASTRAAWRDLPERYGPWKTAHERLRTWTADGTWEKLLEHVVVTQG